LRALIGWSYDLLSEEEKGYLRIASVFVGGYPKTVAIWWPYASFRRFAFEKPDRKENDEYICTENHQQITYAQPCEDHRDEPSRTMAWSSAIKIRIISVIFRSP